MHALRKTLLTLMGCGGLLLGAALVGQGCESAETAFDCQAVCSRYADCYDPNYDVGACRDRCRTAAKNDSEIRSKADQCEACIGDKSCLSATFQCGLTCGAIVP